MEGCGPPSRSPSSLTFAPSQPGQDLAPLPIAAVGRVTTIFDSGATNTMSPENELFHENDFIAEHGTVRMGNDSEIPSTGKGPTDLGITLHVPDLLMGLISTGQDDINGLYTTFGGGKVTVTDKAPVLHGAIIRKGVLRRGLYRLIASPARLTDTTYDKIHSIGHWNIPKLNRMIKHGAALGLPHSRISKLGRPRCDACQMGSMRQPIVNTTDQRARRAERRAYRAARHRLRQKLRAFEELGRVYTKLEVVGVDLVDLGKGHGPRRWAGFFIDFCTRKSWIYLGRRKTDFKVKMLDPFLKEVVAPTNLTVSHFQSDHAADFWTPLVRASLPPGTRVRRSAPYMQAQNGLVEQRIGTVKDKARVLMLANEAPEKHRPDALLYANDIICASPVSDDPTRSPDERFSGIKPDFSKWLPFWSLAYAHEPRATRGEAGWASKGTKCRVLGRSAAMKDSYRVILLRRNKLTREVDRYKVASDWRLPTFAHRDSSTPVATDHPPPPVDAPIAPSPSVPSVAAEDCDDADFPGGHRPVPTADDLLSPFPSRLEPPEPLAIRSPPQSGGASPVIPNSACADEREQLKIDEVPNSTGADEREEQARIDEVATLGRGQRRRQPSMKIRSAPALHARNKLFAQRIGTRRSEKVISELTKLTRKRAAFAGRSISWRAAKAEVRAAVAKAVMERDKELSDDSLPPLPRDCYEASDPDFPHSKDWIRAIEVEKEAIEEHGTYTLSDWKGRTVKSKIAFRVTREPDGSLKFKARLCGKGFTERLGIDYFGTFAPTIATRSLHILLHIAASEDREMRHIDVAGAYLESPMDTTIYMQLPLDMTGGKVVVVKLLKSIYGLKQSGDLWNKRLDGILKGLGFSRSTSDPCVYFKSTTPGGPRMYLCVYVDDILVISSTNSEIDDFESAFKTCVTRIKSGPVVRYVGVDIKRDRENRLITLSQAPYLHELLRSEGMSGCKPKRNPASALRNLHDAPRGEADDMRPLAGKIRYVVDHTRPESLFVASHLSSAASEPGLEHVAASKHLLRYFSGTPEQGLTLGGAGPIELEGWVDAALVEEGESLSQLGLCWRLNKTSGMAFSRSMRDRHVSLSSAEAEFRALKELTAEVVWAREFLSELGYKQTSPTKCHEDNAAVIDLCKSTRINGRTKHITKVMNFVRSHISQGTIAMVKVAGEDNVADIFTKALPAPLFSKHCRTLLGSK